MYIFTYIYIGCFCCTAKKTPCPYLFAHSEGKRLQLSYIFVNLCTYIHMHVDSFTCIVSTNLPTYPPKYPIHT